MTNLTTRIGDYADTGKPLFALVDSHSFYVIGYFERNQVAPYPRRCTSTNYLYSDNKTLRGHVSSIGRAIYDQSVESDSSLIPDVKPNVPWVRLAQRVPVRFALDKVPGDVTLVSGTTCSIAVRSIMNASSWSLRNLPWFKATLAQWCYALRNTIAMCLALTVAYYLNLDEPYWAMTSAAVVSFPTVGGVISKSLGRIASAVPREPLRHCFLPGIRSMSRGFFY